MKTTLTTVTVIEVGLLVVVLATCLIAIDIVLRRIASALEGVRPLIPEGHAGGQVGSRLRDLNHRLERIATALDDMAGRRAPRSW